MIDSKEILDQLESLAKLDVDAVHDEQHQALRGFAA